MRITQEETDSDEEKGKTDNQAAGKGVCKVGAVQWPRKGSFYTLEAARVIGRGVLLLEHV